MLAGAAFLIAAPSTSGIATARLAEDVTAAATTTAVNLRKEVDMVSSPFRF
jgi:hypothetical protein